MVHKLAIATLFLIVPTLSIAGDIEEIKAHFKNAVQGYNELDAEKVHANSHDEWVGFGPLAPYASEGKAAGLDTLRSLFSTTDRMVLAPVGVQVRVIGKTGIVWGYYMMTMKPKDGPAQPRAGRFLTTFAKVKDKWYSVSTQITPISLGE
jgi:ketosteroid isomerase-like protein